MNSGIAIGIGFTLPSVTDSRRAARAGERRAPVTTAAAPPATRMPRRLIALLLGYPTSRINQFPTLNSRRSVAEHFAWIEVDDDFLPGFVFSRRQELVGRTSAHAAQRGLRRHLEDRVGALVEDDGVDRKRSILLEIDLHGHDEVA